MSRFLWVVFQLHDICEQSCDEGIRNVIRTLPKGLGATYAKALARVVERGKADFARRLFRLVAAARRSLTLAEVREVMYVEPGQDSFRHDRLVNNVERLARWCGNLVTVDEEDYTVEFAHHSVIHYLCSEGDGAELTAVVASVLPAAHTSGFFHFARAEADHAIGELCVTYLSFSDFNQALTQRRSRGNETSQPPRAAVQPAEVAEVSLAANGQPGISAAVSGVSRLLRFAPSSLRQQQKQPALAQDTVDVLLRLGSASGGGENAASDDAPPSASSMDQQYAFLAYAQKFWLDHTASFSQTTSRTWHQWVQLLARDERFADPNGSGVPTESTQTNAVNRQKTPRSSPDPIVECIVRYTHCALLEWLHGHSSSADVNMSANGTYRDRRLALLRRAAEAGRDTLVATLMRRYRYDAGTVRAALVLAATGGHIGVVRCLIVDSDDAMTTKTDDEEATSLHRSKGSSEHGLANTPASAPSQYQHQREQRKQTYLDVALRAAAAHGHLDLVDALLAYGADANAPSPSTAFGRTALQAAAERGHHAVVERLLSAKAAAATAASGAKRAFVVNGNNRINRNHDNDDNDEGDDDEDDDLQTALSAAAAGGHLSTVELLLASGAVQPDPPPPRRTAAVGSGRASALQLAARYGQAQVVARLLDAGADVNCAPSLVSQTALHEAAECGSVAVVDLLLQRGAMVHQPCQQRFSTALQVAAAYGHVGVIQRLLRSIAISGDVHAEDMLAAQRWAEERGHKEAAKLLKSAAKPRHKRSYL
jgi:ankyrin repeat protein